MGESKHATKPCECCGKSMTVRTADIKRGWGRFCSKTCKARHQERRTGAHRAHMRNLQDGPDDPRHMSMEELSGGGYGDATRYDAPGHDKW